MKLSQKLLMFAVVFYLAPWIPHGNAAGKCSSRDSIYSKALKGHTFYTFKANHPSDCVKRRENELKCQSYNHVLKEKVCELNNRSKGARPEDYVTDPARIYMTIQFNRGKYFQIYLATPKPKMAPKMSTNSSQYFFCDKPIRKGMLLKRGMGNGEWGMRNCGVCTVCTVRRRDEDCTW